MSVPEVLGHPQVAGRDFVRRFASVPGLDGPVDIVSVGALFDGRRPATETPPPQLGQDTAILLDRMGFGTEAIETLRREGVI